MIPSIYRIFDDGSASLHIMPKPSTDWIIEDIDYLQSIGITQIISMLQPSEVISLGLEREQEICESKDILFKEFPIEDRSVPSLALMRHVVEEIIDDIQCGQHIVVHCRGGIGRAGTLASCVLIGLGSRPDRAIEIVSDARGCSVPDTTEQLNFIRSFKPTHEPET